MGANTIPISGSKPGRRGFPALPCILCGDAEGNVTVRLENVGEFHCDACGEDFDADAVRDQLAKWQAVLQWCDAAPAVAQ